MCLLPLFKVLKKKYFIKIFLNVRKTLGKGYNTWKKLFSYFEKKCKQFCGKGGNISEKRETILHISTILKIKITSGEKMYNALRKPLQYFVK